MVLCGMEPVYLLAVWAVIEGNRKEKVLGQASPCVPLHLLLPCIPICVCCSVGEEEALKSGGDFVTHF